MLRNSVPDLLRAHAEQRPHTAALASVQGPSLTYGDWWKRSSSFAAALAEGGVSAGDRIALLGDNSCYEEVGIAYIGILLAGATVLPLATTYGGENLQSVVGEAAIELVVDCSRAVDHTSKRRTVSLDQFASSHTRERDLPPANPEAPAEIISTSGTTGKPRLAEVSHKSLAWEQGREPPERKEPYHFVHGLTLGTNIGQVALRSSLTLGRTVVALDTFSLETYFRLARELPMRETLLVPAMAASLAAEGVQRGLAFSAVESVVVSGAATPRATWQRLARVFPRAQLINSYTTTEAWPAQVCTVVDPSRPISAGRPPDGQAVEIRNDAGRRLPPFQRGTVFLAHSLGAPRRLVDGREWQASGGWIETDDVGYLDADGYLFLEDRKSDVVLTGGFSVSTLEIEEALTEHPAIVEAAVVGLPHPTLGEYLAAWVIGATVLDLDELRQRLTGELAPHKIPHVIEQRETLPRTRSGKVAKGVLRQESETRPYQTGTHPTTEDEAVIQAIWMEVLERPVQGVDQPFFALGGDSLVALRVVARIQDEFDEDISMSEILTAATIRQQAIVVASARRDDQGENT